jgi:dTDP-4-dehydrorhamnose 3,5-epimerase
MRTDTLPNITGMPENWTVTGPRDPQLVRADWNPVEPIGIDGVNAKQITNVLTSDGYLTEIWRSDWGLDERGVAQIFQRVIEPGGVSGWHAHGDTFDRLFCAYGRVRLGLYDGRADSPTHGQSAAIRLGRERPAIVVVPPGVWHAVANVGSEPAVFVNAVDRAYAYDDPDHYRVPIDSPQIPVAF